MKCRFMILIGFACLSLWLASTSASAEVVHRNQYGDPYFLNDYTSAYLVCKNDNGNFKVDQCTWKEDGIYHHGNKNIAVYDSRTGILNVTENGNHEGRTYYAGAYSFSDGSMYMRNDGGGDPVSQAMKDKWGVDMSFSELYAYASSLESSNTYVSNFSSSCSDTLNVYKTYITQQGSDLNDPADPADPDGFLSKSIKRVSDPFLDIFGTIYIKITDFLIDNSIYLICVLSVLIILIIGLRAFYYLDWYYNHGGMFRR